MGHIQPDLLKDLKRELTAISKLAGMKEKKPGIFYYKSIPFLHFHLDDDGRSADVKTHRGWKRVPIDFAAKKLARDQFLEIAFSAYFEISQKRKTPSRKAARG